MRLLKLAAAFFVAGLALYGPPALATGAIHIEWLREGYVYGAQTISTTGSVSVASSAAPDFGSQGGQARITVTQGAVVATWGPTPTATQTNGVRLDIRQVAPITIPFKTGDEIAIVEATDPPPSSGGGGGAITAAAGSYAAGALSAGAGVDGWNLTTGAQADAVCATDNGTCSEIALLKRDNARLTSLITALGSPFQTGGSIGNTAFIANAGTNLNTSALALDATVGTTNTDVGPPGATACATDTGSCSGNALWQRIAQRLSSLITAVGTPMQATGGTVTANAGTNLNTSALALDATVGTTNTDVGPPGATACATDTGSCSGNALWQRIAQRLTTINTTMGSPIQTTGGTVGIVAGTAVIGHVIADSGSTTAVSGNVAVTKADASDVTFGAKADAATCATTNTAMACLRQLHADMIAATPAGANVIGHVIADSGSTTAVTGTVTASSTLQTQTDTVMVGGVNVKEINAVTPLMGTGAVGTGSQRIAVGTDTATVAGSAPAAIGAGSTGSAVPTGATYAGANSSGNLTGIIQADTSAAVSVSTATTTQIIALSGSKVTYVTHWDLVTTLADNVTWEYGTGSNCVTGTTTLTGAYPLAANGGVATGSGLGPVLIVPAGKELCLLTSASTQISGAVSYTQF